MIQSRVVTKKHFFLVGYLWEDFFRAQYFTKVVAANHSSTDTLFLRRALETINCIYEMNLTDLFKAEFYFKGALTAIHLSCTIIFFQETTWSDLVFSAVLCFFKTSTCTHPFSHRHWVNSQVQLQPSIRWISIFYYKRVITATHSFKFTVFLQNRNFSNRIVTIILILPWFQASIYWKQFIIWRHHLQPSIFFLW